LAANDFVEWVGDAVPVIFEIFPVSGN